MFRSIEALIGLGQRADRLGEIVNVNSKMSRRTAIQLLAATVVGAPTLATILSGCGPAEPAKSIVDALSKLQDSPYGKFIVINKDTGEPVIMNDPHPVRIKITAPKRNLERPNTEGKVILRREPTLKKEQDVEATWPSQIKTDYAVRVFGGGYSGTQWGEQSVNYKGQEYPGGVWFALSDEKGNFVSPFGTVLRSGEKPFYVAANSVDLVAEVGPITLGEAAALEAKGFYKGIVFITKQIDEDNILNVRSDPHTVDKLGQPRVDNLVSWDKIVSLVGTDITGINTFSVLNPLISDGDNPNFDKGRYPSVWLAFMGEVIVNKNPLVTRRVRLFINMSEQTIRPKYLQPDSLSWDLNVVRFQITSDNMLPEDPTKKISALKDLSAVRK